jgi:hypothetical protein
MAFRSTPYARLGNHLLSFRSGVIRMVSTTLARSSARAPRRRKGKFVTIPSKAATTKNTIASLNQMTLPIGSSNERLFVITATRCLGLHHAAIAVSRAAHRCLYGSLRFGALSPIRSSGARSIPDTRWPESEWGVPRGSEGVGKEAEGLSRARWRPLLRDPVVPILVTAGVFDWLSGNPIHSILLFAAALALLRETVRIRPATAPISLPTPPPWLLVMISVLFAVLIGEFGRYSWPATVAVVVPTTTGLYLGWRGPPRPQAETPAIGRSGALAWTSVFVGLGLWELAALLLQPSLTTDSYAHPTISVLTDAFLATHLGRSVSLVVWLAIGWYLVTA